LRLAAALGLSCFSWLPFRTTKYTNHTKKSRSGRATAVLDSEFLSPSASSALSAVQKIGRPRITFFVTLFTSARRIWKESAKSGNYFLKTFFSRSLCARFLLSIFKITRIIKLDADRWLRSSIQCRLLSE
jgi:hypothetical protein